MFCPKQLVMPPSGCNCSHCQHSTIKLLAEGSGRVSCMGIETAIFWWPIISITNLDYQQTGKIIWSVPHAKLIILNSISFNQLRCHWLLASTFLIRLGLLTSGPACVEFSWKIWRFPSNNKHKGAISTFN